MAAGTQMSESRDSDQVRDTEITLSTGKLLGVFFFLAILCGVFFTMGYMLGKSTGGSGRTEIVGTVPSIGNAAGKPPAGNKATQPQPQTPSQDASNGGASATGADASTAKNPDASASQPSSTGKTPDQPSSQPAAPNAAGGSFMVQVAAVSKQEDAEILKAALQKKQYPVFIATSAGDPLFHVQVGPFTDRKDAEAMKAKLAADGYGAIVK
jgi:cell division septation protein DedD